MKSERLDRSCDIDYKKSNPNFFAPNSDNFFYLPQPRMIGRRVPRELKRKLDSFYENESNFKKLVELVSRRSGRRFSLRLLHYVAVNAHVLTGRAELSNEYYLQLESRGKRYFDAFRRAARFTYRHHTLGAVSTNIAQLRFIKWFITRGLYKWLVSNREKAEIAMRSSSRSPSISSVSSSSRSRSTSRRRKGVSVNCVSVSNAVLSH